MDKYVINALAGYDHLVDTVFLQSAIKDNYHSNKTQLDNKQQQITQQTLIDNND